MSRYGSGAAQRTPACRGVRTEEMLKLAQLFLRHGGSQRPTTVRRPCAVTGFDLLRRFRFLYDRPTPLGARRPDRCSWLPETPVEQRLRRRPDAPVPGIGERGDRQASAVDEVRESHDQPDAAHQGAADGRRGLGRCRHPGRPVAIQPALHPREGRPTARRRPSSAPQGVELL
jgi:hypothetical protein